MGIYRAGTGFGVKMSLVGTHRPMIQAVYEHFGIGHFSTQKRQAVQHTPRGPVLGKQGWRWQVSSRQDVLTILTAIRPHLIEKADQADIVMAYCRGEMSGEDAEAQCKAAKRFEFGADGFDAYAPRRNDGNNAGESNPAATITEAQAEVIRSRLASGDRGSDIARDLGVSKSLVSRVRRGRTWNDGSFPVRTGYVRGEQHPAATVTAETVADIRSRLESGERGADIARALGVSASLVSRIKTGKTWSHA